MTEAEVAKVKEALLTARRCITAYVRPGEHLLHEEAEAITAIDEALAVLEPTKGWVL